VAEGDDKGPMHDPFGSLLGEVRMIRRLMAAAGRPFSTPDGANCDGAGLGIVRFRGPANGQVWRLESIGVSVSGASAAGVVAAYLGGAVDPDESNLLPGFFLSALNGNAPSRGVLAPNRPAYVPGGTPVLVVVRGAAAAAQVMARIQGRVEELAEVQGSGGIGSLPGPPVTVGQV
jgi:hypothetical protein